MKFARTLLLCGAMVVGLDVAATETPRRADDFVDAVGINLDLNFPSTVYSQSLVGQLGIRHFRCNVQPVPSGFLDRLTSLYANYGCRINLVCDSTAYSPAQYCGLMAGPAFESIEGFNEPDVTGPRSYAGLTDNWGAQSYPATLAFQRDIFNDMNSQSATSSKAVLSPAMANPAFSRYLRSAPADFIAVHSYPMQQLPTGNFLESYAFPAAQLMETPGAGVTHVITTETGYQSGTLSTDISNLAAAKYIPRTMAEYFRLGVFRTYLFELADANGYHYGLLDGTFTPKPAYYTTKNLIGLLGESAWNAGTGQMTLPVSFNPSVLDYTMTGLTANIHHVLLQKSNGTLYLLLWQEIPSYDLTAHVDIVNPTIPVQINFNAPIASATSFQLESTTPLSTVNNPQSLTVNVPDELLIVELMRGAPAAPTGTVASIVANPGGSTVSPFSAGGVVVTRTGSTASPLNVSYSIGGSAINGVDYSALTGMVQIGAGSNSANISISPTNPLFVGGKDVVLSIAPSSSYTEATLLTSKVYLNASRTLVADFESGIHGWKGNTFSTVALDTANADTGSNSLKWVYSNGGVNRWANTIQLSFASPQDWSNISRLELRIKEGASNSASDIGAPVFFTWVNSGVVVGGSAGASKFPLGHDTVYRSVSMELGNLPRNQVNSIVFYVDGKALAAGTYTFYLDNICAVTDTNNVLDDSEQYAGANWSSESQSSISGDILNADTGAYGLKWTYNDDGTTRWCNSVGIYFAPPCDLTRYSTLSLRFKEDSTNPIADVGSLVYLDWHNNRVSTSNGFGVASFPLTGATGYRTVEISLGSFNRDKVDYICLYVDGTRLGMGKHIWYLDNLSYY
jgi:hypothetical protein